LDVLTTVIELLVRPDQLLAFTHQILHIPHNEFAISKNYSKQHDFG
jgi:hypothetical protein